MGSAGESIMTGSSPNGAGGKAAGNVWDSGRWAGVREVTIDFMTRYIFEEIVRRFPPAGQEILELGCGTGRLGWLLLKGGAAHVTLVDSSRRAVELARTLFGREDPSRYAIVEADVESAGTGRRYDLVFSSGLIEHFRGDGRRRVIRQHLARARRACIMVHPSDTLYAALFNRFPPAVRRYGFQRSFSLAEIDGHLASLGGVASWHHARFHFFYTVPLLHNREGLNRAADRVLGRGGLTLTHVLMKGAP
jgi:SAM-dependent methyltransferase